MKREEEYQKLRQLAETGLGNIDRTIKRIKKWHTAGYITYVEEMRMIKHWYDGGYITQVEALSMIKQLKLVEAILI